MDKTVGSVPMTDVVIRYCLPYYIVFSPAPKRRSIGSIRSAIITENITDAIADAITV